MAAGMSDSAFQGRRRRWFAKVEKAARAAGMAVERGGSAERRIVVGPATSIVVRFCRGNASNGETFLSQWADVYIDNKFRRSFSSWGWTDAGIGAADFFDSIARGNPVDVRVMVAHAAGVSA